MALTRSEIMKRVKSAETGPEIELRRALRAAGLRGYRKNWKGVAGKPDVCWPGRKLAVFLDSCFWHLCPAHGKIPKANRERWRAKLERTRERDAEQTRELVAAGWTVLRFWTHESTGGMVERVRRALTGNGSEPSATPSPSRSRNGSVNG